jgi:hypothetical protein
MGIWWQHCLAVGRTSCSCAWRETLSLAVSDSAVSAGKCLWWSSKAIQQYTTLWHGATYCLGLVGHTAIHHTLTWCYLLLGPSGPYSSTPHSDMVLLTAWA